MGQRTDQIRRETIASVLLDTPVHQLPELVRQPRRPGHLRSDGRHAGEGCDAERHVGVMRPEEPRAEATVGMTGKDHAMRGGHAHHIVCLLGVCLCLRLPERSSLS